MSVKEEVKSTIYAFFEAMNTQDLATIQSLIPKSDSTIHVGTDTGEIWKGWNVINEATKEQFEELQYYKADIYDLTITLSESCKVAWYFHKLDAEIKSGGNIFNWEEARFTGVLQKVDGQWVMAQTHVSIPEST